MAEKNLDFDAVIDRSNTNCLKYDFAAARGMPEDILPLWVADMDFRVSSYIQEALHSQAEHGIYGYSEAKGDYFAALSAWMEERHGWKVYEKWLVKTPGVVFALAMAIKAFTKEGDGVMIQQPVYYPFSEVIKDNDRKVVNNSLVQNKNGKYEMNLADLEEKIVKEKVKLLFLCNPHNPVGRVWTKEELERLGEICRKYDVIVVSDEIHEDFVYEGKHQVFADIKKEYLDFTITCTSPSKTFNIAGLQVSNIFIANSQLKRKFKKQIDASGYSQINAAGLIACQAAYEKGGEWYEAMLAYIKENLAYIREFLETRLPEVKMIMPEGTYLAWLDFRALKLADSELDDFMIHKAGLWLDGGSIFGDEGKGFQRINAACPKETLKRALTRLEKAVKEKRQ